MTLQVPVPLHYLVAIALLLVIAMPAYPSSVRAATVPPKLFTAVYTLSMSGIPIATVERQLRKDDVGRFVFRSETQAKGVVKLFRQDHMVEESVWSLAGDEPRPLSYSYRHTGTDELRFQTVTFDWQRHRIDNREDDRRWRLQPVPHLLDKLLYQLAIMWDLEDGKRQLEYRFVDGGEIKTYRFANHGEETLETPLGAIKTVKLERITEKGDKRKTTLWCARDWRYLPVRIDGQDRSGRLLSAVIERWSGFAEKPASPKTPNEIGTRSPG